MAAFDVAMAHGSTDLPMACRALRVPNTTMFDYEYARLQHGLNCRLAQRVLMPDAIPPERVAGYGARPPKLVTYPGLKEEYYLADFRPDAAVAAALGLDGERIGLVLRPPADLALYHRFENPLFDALLEQLGRQRDRCAGWCCRARRIRRSGSGRWRCPRCWCRSQRWTARAWWPGADLVISAGGTMNREAVVLGTPVYTTFAGRLGGVDERLIAEGRLRPLERLDDLVLERKPASARDRVRRDPDRLIDLAVQGLARG